MADTFGSRLKHAWNSFLGKDEEPLYSPEYGNISYASSSRIDRVKPRFTNERSIISSIYTRFSIDAASIEIKHVRLDDDERYLEDMPSMLNECLTVSSNIDQPARDFRQDAVMQLLDSGVIAIIPVDTTLNPNETGSYDIKTLRVGKIVTWYPQHVRVEAYNERTGNREEVTLHKSFVAIVTNPFYSVMNEPNSTLQRLIRKLSLLDTVDEQSSSGKLDLIIKLPYVVKTDTRREQAEVRRKDIEMQLRGSQYGIAYVDQTENITQLNRPVENNLLSQVTYLTNLLYSQLGFSEEVLKGSATEETMQNYFNRTIEPIVDAVVESMNRTFLTKTARSQGQAIKYFRDPFKLIPVTKVVEMADVFSRNEIATANEMRGAVGWKPAKDPKADKLMNSNMPQPNQDVERNNPEQSAGSTTKEESP